MQVIKIFSSGNEIAKMNPCENTGVLKKFLQLALSILLTYGGTTLAKHPWDCVAGDKDERLYCKALYKDDPSFCESITNESMKVTCYARIQFEQSICNSIKDKKIKNHCKTTVARDKEAKESFSVPPEIRAMSARHWPVK